MSAQVGRRKPPRKSRRSTESALRQRTISPEALDASPDGLFVVDADQRIILWSRGAEKLLGYKKRDVLGRACHEVIQGEDGSGGKSCRERCSVKRSAERGRSVSGIDLLVRRKNGRQLRASLSTIVLPDKKKPRTLHQLRKADRKAVLTGDGRVVTAGGDPPRAALRTLSGTWLGEDRRLYTKLRIGMPLLGRCNLAESPLLKEIGNLRWQHFEALTGVPSAQLVDDDGERLYATFFFVELVFPQNRPMASFGENDEIRVVSTLRRFGEFILDGEHFLCAGNGSASPDPAREMSLEEARVRGIPFLRLSNVFVKQWGGADWLKKARPTGDRMAAVPETKTAPMSVTLTAKARGGESFPPPGRTFTSLVDEEAEASYRIVPDRDINGVGLLYFANYPRYLDICERDVLSDRGELSLNREQLDARTLLHRRSAYFSNALSDDVLDVRIRAWVENPFLAGRPDPAGHPVNLHLSYRMHRRSDRRLMLVSSARKTLYGMKLGDVPSLRSYLEDRAAARTSPARRERPSLVE